ncbi:Thimet oligopeptidase, partial [Podila clonocystis]
MSSPIILPNSAEDLEAITQNVITILQRGADQVVAIPEDKRSIENTLLALQEAQSEAACIQTLCTFPAMEGQEKLMVIRSDISSMELDFQKNLNEDTTEILLTGDELEGCSEAWLSGLKTQKVDGQVYYRVTMKSPDILNIGKNASLPLTRKRVSVTYRQVCTATNGPILELLIKLRHDAATLLGYKNHAAYQLDINMAKTIETVESFLDNITTSIASKLESDRQELMDLKKTEYQQRGWSQNFDGELQSSDVKYYQELLFKEKYAVDNNHIQEYFPLDYVRDQILGISQIITFFHEFGHVCHALSNKVRHSLFNFSWSVAPYPTSLPMDFLEVPSIMFENWLWDPAVLRRLSKHYKTGNQLPEDIIQSLTRTRKVSAGLKFSQQIAVTAVDLKLHMVDPNERQETIPQIWKEMTERLVGVRLEGGPGCNPAAQFYHIAMGYDAG